MTIQFVTEYLDNKIAEKELENIGKHYTTVYDDKNKILKKLRKILKK